MLKRLRFLAISALIFTNACQNTTEGEKASAKPELAAPANFSVRLVRSSSASNYTFSFNAVENAAHYLIYYSQTNDPSTAASLASGAFPPITWSNPNSKQYGDKLHYFWIRTYNGERYGNWSNSISQVLD